MSVRCWLAMLFLGLLAIGSPTRVTATGLFDDDKKITSGDIKDITYWRTRWTMDRLDEAIKSRQPEGAIAVQVGSLLRTLEDLTKMYPQHMGLKKWYAHVQEIDKKIDPNANRRESFKEGCLWAEGDYELGYAALHCAQMAAAEKSWEQARDWGRLATQKLGFLQARLDKGERVANWPPEFVTWIKESRPQADSLMADVRTHLR